MTLETLKVVITADASGFNKQIKSVKNSLANLDASISNSTNGISQSLKSITKSVSFVAITAGLTKLASTAIKTASDLKEVQNVVDQAFGKKYNKEVDDFAKNAINQFGLSELAAKKYSSTLMAMGTSMGITADKSKTMAIQLTGLAADLASFYNTDVETAYNALQGAYTGITRALRQYGINMSEAEVKNYALSKGITKTYDALSEAEKATLRYNYILEHSTLAQNDFVNTHATWANSLKIISNQFEQLATVMGTLIISVLTPIVQLLSQIISYAIKAAQALAAMFGVSLSFSNGGSDVAGMWDDATDATNEASNAAKKYKKLIDGFDELNIQTSESGSGSQGAFGGGFDVGSYFDITTTPMEMLDFNKMIQELNNWITQFESKIIELGKIIGEKFNDLFNYVDWKLLGSTLILGLNTVFASVNNFFNTANFTNAGEKIAEFFNSIFADLKPEVWGQILVNKFNALYQSLNGLVSNLDWQLIGDKIQETIRQALDKLDVNSMADTVINTFNGITTIILGWADSFPIAEFGAKIWEAIDKTIKGIDAKALGQSLNKLITQVFEALRGIDYSKITKAIAEFFEGLDIVELFKKYVITKVELIGEALSGLFSTPSGAAIGLVGIVITLSSALANLAAGPLGTLNTQMLLAQQVSMETGTALVGLLNPLVNLNLGWDRLGNAVKKFVGADSKGLINNIKDINFAMRDMGAMSYLKEMFSDIGVAVKTGLGSALQLLLNPVGALKTAFTALQGAAQSLWALLAANPIALVAAAIAALAATFIYAYQHSETLRNNIALIWEQLKSFFTFLIEQVKIIWEVWIKPLFDHIGEVIKNLMDKVITPLWEFISEVVAMIIELLNNVLQPVIDALMTWFSTVFFGTTTGVIESILNIVNAAIEVLGGLIQAAKTILEGLIEFLAGVFTGDWSKAWEGIKKIVGGVWDGIVAIFKGAINSCIGFINGWISAVQSAISSIVRGINSIHFSVSIPDWVPIIGGNSYSLGFNLNTPQLPKIPYLADGGVLTSPTMAMLGEYPGAANNPEIATPQSLLRETIDASNGEMVSAFAQMTNQIITAINELDMNVSIGDDVIANSASRGDKAYKKRTGKSLFAY